MIHIFPSKNDKLNSNWNVPNVMVIFLFCEQFHSFGAYFVLHLLDENPYDIHKINSFRQIQIEGFWNNFHSHK